MYKLAKPGWFSEVNGVKVVAHDLGTIPGFMEHAGHFVAHHGIEWHRQQGDAADIFNTEKARGYPIATWSVGNAGEIHQYNHWDYADWHGDSPSQYAFGIEHAGFTGTPCPAKQLDSSAALCAAIVEMTHEHFGETIPLVHVPRISIGNYRSAKGFWDHDDVDNGPLNENGHTDHLEGRNWTEQLAVIGKLLAKKPAAVPTFHGTLLSLGVTAPDVLVWKKRMGVKGFFELKSSNSGPHYGNAIEHSTVLFQRRAGVADDGVVGPKTWEAAWS